MPNWRSRLALSTLTHVSTSWTNLRKWRGVHFLEKPNGSKKNVPFKLSRVGVHIWKRTALNFPKPDPGKTHVVHGTKIEAETANETVRNSSNCLPILEAEKLKLHTDKICCQAAAGPHLFEPFTPTPSGRLSQLPPNGNV